MAEAKPDGKIHLKDVPGTGLPGPEVLWNKVLDRIKDNGMVWFPDYEIRAEGKRRLPGTEKSYLLRLVPSPIWKELRILILESSSTQVRQGWRLSILFFDTHSQPPQRPYP
ncbi:hypothetical protein F5Y00DRAFT_245102 [Daldinia vernicosa]|uniref:uncharacterized protein n=1 Tax=Daldinia vernicosa TaxID=114800 RepID=UPI0020075B79|nr:uncharacterized protein F5Y00DRAFT_245102 [Daldinia vernicosa]KAI0846002.1 hypothetical protein F5Y00DRAFT_245102 [Daldinia vernicosa]